MQDVPQRHAFEGLLGNHERQPPGQAPLYLLLPQQGTPHTPTVTLTQQHLQQSCILSGRAASHCDLNVTTVS